MLHFTVLSNTTWEWKRQGRWQCLINMGLRYSPNVHSLPIVCQVQEFPRVYCGDMAVLRKSVEQLKFVSSIRKPSEIKILCATNFIMSTAMTIQKTKWMSHVLVDLTHDTQEL